MRIRKMKKDTIANRIENKAVFCNYIEVLSGEISNNLEETEKELFKLNIVDKPINDIIDKIRAFNFLIEELAGQSFIELQNCFEELNELKDNAGNL
jgi:hypothetical protein